MKITNKHNLPHALVALAHLDPYDKGDADISVTGLLQPPRMMLIREFYGDQLTVDVSDLALRLVGQSFHRLCEAVEEPDTVTEQRFSKDYIIDVNGVNKTLRVSGAIDRIEGYGSSVVTLMDYKVTTAAKVKNIVNYNEVNSPYGASYEWTFQLNMYRDLYCHHTSAPYNHVDMQIIALARDHQSHQSCQPITRYIPEGWSPSDVQWCLNTCATRHILAREKFLETGELPLCTEGEQWLERGTYAPNSKRKAGPIKPPRFKRCEQFCDAASLCTQYAADKRRAESEAIFIQGTGEVPEGSFYEQI